MAALGVAKGVTAESSLTDGGDGGNGPSSGSEKARADLADERLGRDRFGQHEVESVGGDVACVMTAQQDADTRPRLSTHRHEIRTGAVGMITEPQHADEIITGGDANMVFIARELLREPYWALKAQHALGEEPAWPTPYGYAVKRRTK